MDFSPIFFNNCIPAKFFIKIPKIDLIFPLQNFIICEKNLILAN